MTQSFEILATEIEDALGGITASDILDSSGRGSGSDYKYPEEAASELLSNVIDLYIEQLSEHCREKNDTEALIVCQAIILALYNFQNSEEFVEVEEHAAEFPEEAAQAVLRICQSNGDGEKATLSQPLSTRPIFAEFVANYVPKWQWILLVGKES